MISRRQLSFTPFNPELPNSTGRLTFSREMRQALEARRTEGNSAPSGETFTQALHAEMLQENFPLA